MMRLALSCILFGAATILSQSVQPTPLDSRSQRWTSNHQWHSSKTYCRWCAVNLATSSNRQVREDEFVCVCVCFEFLIYVSSPMYVRDAVGHFVSSPAGQVT